MKKLAVATAAALALGFLVACPGERGGPPPATLKEKVAIIQLELDASNQVTGLREPDTDDRKSNGKELAVSKKGQEFAHWVTFPLSADVTLDIAMKPGTSSPFEGKFESRGRHVFSGSVSDAAKVDSRYLYSVKVRDNKTGKDFTLDPPIRIDP